MRSLRSAFFDVLGLLSFSSAFAFFVFRCIYTSPDKWENWARFLDVNKDVPKISLTVLKLKLNQEIEEAIGIRSFILFRFLCMILSFEFRCCRICFLVVEDLSY